MPVRRTSFLAFILACVATVAAPATAAPPVVGNINVRGLQAGATTTLVIDGSDLLPEPRLVTTAPITAQTVTPGAAPNRIEIDVTLDAKADPGLYNLWLVTAKGASLRQVLTVDALPQRPMAPEVDALPVALHGNFTGGRAIETTFPGKAGERVTVEVEAQRLGGKDQPVIHLLDPAGREIGLALPSPLLRGDARLAATLPADGAYRVRVHDLQYASSAPLRLKIGSWQYADLAFPPAVERGRTGQIALIGAEPAGPRVDVVAGPAAFAVPPPWADAAKASGPRPVVYVSGLPELVENEAAGSSPEAPQDLSAAKPPFGVSGRLVKPGEQDFYRLVVTADATLRFEVVAERTGSPLDAVLELRNAKGDRVAESDDGPESSDPRLDYKLPPGTDALIACVRDVHGRGADAGVYRLVVSPVGPGGMVANPPRPEFDLVVQEDAVALTGGAPYLMKVTARRRGYDGPIRLRLEATPGWVSLGGNEIPAGRDAAVMTLTAAAPSGGVPAPIVAALLGEGSDAAGPIARVAGAEQHPLGEIQPWLRGELLLASAGEPDVAFAADFGDVPADRKLVPGSKVMVPAKCVRPVGFDGPVRLTLVTNHAAPLDANTGRPDPNRALRTEQERIDIPPDPKATAAFDAKTAAEKAVADAKKAVEAAAANPDPTAKAAAMAAADAALKQATDALTAADAAAVAATAQAKNDVEAPVIVPNDLPLAPGGYDLAFRADLMSRDNTRVLATRFTPIKRLVVASPVAVQLTTPPKVEVRLVADGGTVKWSGTIERREGATGEVAVFAEGLPDGVPQPRVAVPADKNTFDLELKLPPTTPPGETAGVKLIAQINGANGQPVRGAPVDLGLNVLPKEEEAKAAR